MKIQGRVATTPVPRTCNRKCLRRMRVNDVKVFGNNNTQRFSLFFILLFLTFLCDTVLNLFNAFNNEFAIKTLYASTIEFHSKPLYTQCSPTVLICHFRWRVISHTTRNSQWWWRILSFTIYIHYIAKIVFTFRLIVLHQRPELETVQWTNVKELHKLVSKRYVW